MKRSFIFVRYCLLLSFCSFFYVVNAQTFSLVKEINTSSTGDAIAISSFCRAGDNVFFSANDAINGAELWKTDGISASLVKDIFPGSTGSGITALTEAGGILYFAANDGINGNELWRSDGTNAGTYMLKNITAGPAGSAINQFFYHNNILFFIANNVTNGSELWKSDGTEIGTMMVKDINTGFANGMVAGFSPNAFVALGTYIYFPATTTAAGRELWRSDGTDAGTTLVRDIFAGPGGSINFFKAAAYNGKVFFAATSATALGAELWTTDGTVGGTIMIKDIVAGSGNSYPNNFIEYNNALYFSASATNNGNPDLWKSDGTNAGTVKVRDFVADGVSLTIGFNSSINQFTVFNGKLYFNSIGGTLGSEIYVSDGTTAGTGLLKDINTGPNGSAPSGLIVFDNKLYFSATGQNSSLYVSDGTTGGTISLIQNPLSEELSVLPGTFAGLGNRFCFGGNTISKGREVWSIDITSNNVNLVTDINMSRSGTPSQAFLFGSVVSNGYYYFGAADNDSGVELWKSDGTEAGTVRVKDIFPGKGSSTPQNFYAVNGVIYFSANNGANGIELWKTDGTEAGTQMIADIFPGAGSSFPSRIHSSGSNIYFLANHPDYGIELWRSDGTSVGTMLMSDLSPGTASGFANTTDDLTVGDYAYYIAPGGKMYKVDGISDAISDFSPSIITARDLGAIGNTLYILGINAGNQTVLWKSANGNAPTQVKVISNNATGLSLQLTECNGKLFFNANNGTSGQEPWISDGTETGTYMIKDVFAGANSSQPFQFIAANGKVYFQAASSATSDAELWVTDGTDAGTVLVKDIFPGTAGGAFPSGIVATPTGDLLFTANDGINGIELWKSDGTSAGTNLLQEFNSNGDAFNAATRAFNYPQDYILNKLNDGLIFFARSADKGTQLYFGSIAAPIKKLYVNNNSLDGDIFTTAVGNNANNGSAASPFATITYALSQAKVGDTIYVDAGTYTEQVTIDKSVTIWGAGKGVTTIQAPPAPHTPGFNSGYGNEYGVVQTKPSIGDVNLVSVTVDGANQTFEGSTHGILMETNGIIYDCEVKNMKISLVGGGATGSGIYAWSPNQETIAVTVENCSIHDFNYLGAFVVAPSYEFTITKTDINATGALYGMCINAIGLTTNSTQKLWVDYNTITGYNGFGVATNGSANATIKYNSITSTTGYALVNGSSSYFLASCNWYGSTNQEEVVSKINGFAYFTPWLSDGIDTNPFEPGFQPLDNICTGRLTKLYVNDNSTTGDVFTTSVGSNSNNGTAAYPYATLEYALTGAQAGDTIYVDAGNYDLSSNLAINKSITIFGTNYLISPNDATTKSIYNSSRNAEARITGAALVVGADNIFIKGLRFSPTASAISQNGNYSHVKIDKTYFDVVGSGNIVNLQGASGNPIVAFDFSITDSRFERTDISAGASINLGLVRSVWIDDNVFIESPVGNPNRGIAVRTVSGQLVESTAFTNNYMKKLQNAVFALTINDWVIGGNKFDSCSLGFNYSPVAVVGGFVRVAGNTFTNMRSTRSVLVRGGSAGGTNNLVINNNIINQEVNGTNGTTSMIQLEFTTSNTFSSAIVANNVINISGDYSQATTKMNNGIQLSGKHTNTTIEGNEVNFTAINAALPSVPNVFPPVPSAVFINTDAGSGLGLIPSTAVINIRNNKFNGFKTGVAFYDPSPAGITANVGYGYLTTGATANINNNSFTNDSMSIDNGAVSQSVNASCNWYGSAAAQEFINKLSLPTVDIAPWLTNGTDNDAATGFQPVPNSCDGYPTLITLNGSTNVTCNGAANGTINITTSYGKAPFTYTWTKEGDANFVSHDEDPTGLASGTYHLAILDGNGSNIYITDPEADGPGTITITITEPDVLTASAGGSNNVCFNGTIGTASVLPAGGTASYTYLWSNGATANEITNLAAGVYNVTVTDAKGCTTTASYEVTQPTQVIASITNTSTACSNIATVAAGGGTPGYTYLWSNGSTSPTISGVPVGTYNVTVTDANGCTATASVTLTVAEAFNPSASVTNVTCFGANNGIITVTNANGTGQLMFSKDGGVSFVNGSLPFSFTNLAPGTYNIAVKDVNGCTGFVEKTIAQPTVLTATIGSVQSTCFGASTGAINITVSGGTPSYSYSWTGLGGSFSSSQLNISSLAAGDYTLTVRDNNNCTYSLPVTVPSIAAILVSETINNVTCRGAANGSITVNASGGTNYPPPSFNYLWNTGATTTTISNLAPGNYSVRITDNGSGCFINKSYTVTQPTLVLALTTTKTNATGCNSLGTITATGSGGTAPYTYTVNGNVINESSIGGLYAGDYTVTVTDANGCTTSKIVTITDNGSDEYEGNNSKNQAKQIPASGSLTARLALANDAADWFRFTAPVSASGLYSIKTMTTAPNVAYAINVYASGNNTPAIVPVNVINSGEKHYQLTAGTTYFVSITTATLSFICYNLTVSALEPVEITANTPQSRITVEATPVIDMLKAFTYPNPHSGNFTLSIESPEDGVATVEMFTVNGQKLSERKANVVKGKGNTMKYSNMNYAILFYKVSIGKNFATGKIISPN